MPSHFDVGSFFSWSLFCSIELFVYHNYYRFIVSLMSSSQLYSSFLMWFQLFQVISISMSILELVDPVSQTCLVQFCFCCLLLISLGIMGFNDCGFAHRAVETVPLRPSSWLRVESSDSSFTCLCAVFFFLCSLLC